MPRMTVAEYNAHQARHRKANQCADDSAYESESRLQADIKAECLRRGWLVLSGTMNRKTHRTVGEPDLIILCDQGRVLLIECKDKDGKVTQEQGALHAWADKLGHEVHVVRSLERFIEVAPK
jgi:hypothetical protein